MMLVELFMVHRFQNIGLIGDDVMSNTAFRHVVLDIETTGLSPRRGHRIIEIGAVSIEGGHITNEFCSLVKIDREIPLQTQRIHGISNEMLEGQPAADEILPKFYDFLRDSIIVAHNARFDVGFLRHEFNRFSLRFNNKSVCTLKISRMLYPGLSNHRLDTVYRHLFGEIAVNVQRHRALDDARMVAEIWLEMVKR
jgi:DNA polymerase-3 subunit epsilon